MDLALIVIVIVAVAIVGLVGLSITVRRQPATRVDDAHEAGPLDGAMDVVDRSVGMYLLRRLSRQPTADTTEAEEPPAILSADEVAYRIGVAEAPAPAYAPPIAPAPAYALSPPPLVETTETTGTLTDAAAIAAAARAAAAGHAQARAAAGHAPVSATAGAVVVSMGVVAGVARAARGAAPPPKAPGAPRERLIRDAGIALIGMTIIALVGFLILPQSPKGKPSGSVFSVARASQSPDPTDEPTPTATDPNGVGEPTVSPEPTADVASAAPTASAVAIPTPKPTKATLKPTRKPTARPTPTPTPTPTPKPTPKPTPTPGLVAHIASVSPSCGNPGVTVTFTATANTGATYTWDFDDGGGSGRVVSHTYSADAQYQVILTVTRSGDTKIDNVVVNVPC